MTFKETMLVILVALGGLVALVTTYVFVFFILQVGVSLFEISPLWLIPFALITLAAFVGMIYVLMKMANYFDAALAAAEKRAGVEL